MNKSWPRPPNLPLYHLVKYSLLQLECHFFSLKSQWMIWFSSSLLPLSVYKRPMRLRLESPSAPNANEQTARTSTFAHPATNAYANVYANVNADVKTSV